ncbi:triosephosphate isomerase, putative, partial [Hepatocystis sp. ex Piliocolobus tephrosceles]
MVKIFVLLYIYLLNVECIRFNYYTSNAINNLSNNFFFIFDSNNFELKNIKRNIKNSHKVKKLEIKNEYCNKLKKLYSLVNENIIIEGQGGDEQQDNTFHNHMDPSNIQQDHTEQKYIYREENNNHSNNNNFSYKDNNNIISWWGKKKNKTIIANWKCYLLKEEAYKIIDELTKIKYSNNIDVILSTNLLFIPYLLEKIKSNNSKIHVCSQDVSLVNDLGAFTGETTAHLLHNFGGTYTIIGHSERKKGFYNYKETSDQTILKLINAIKSGLKVILCVGDDYMNQHFKILPDKFRDLL